MPYSFLWHVSLVGLLQWNLQPSLVSYNKSITACGNLVGSGDLFLGLGFRVFEIWGLGLGFRGLEFRVFEIWGLGA